MCRKAFGGMGRGTMLRSCPRPACRAGQPTFSGSDRLMTHPQTPSLQKAGQQAVAQNIQALAGFLKHYPPFDAMEQAHVLFLLERSRLVFFAAGQPIITPADGKVRFWYVVRQGHVQGLRGDGREEPDVPLNLLPGDGFPFAAIIGERASRRTYTAVEDTFCLQLPVPDFARLAETSEAFGQYAMRGVSSLLGRIGNRLQASAAQTLSESESLATPLAEMLTREPITCTPETSVREAVRRMHDKRAGSIAVVDAQQRLAGIFTLRDLRGLVIDPQANLDGPIEQVMTRKPYHLPPTATAFDATELMAQHHFAHVCIVEDGRLRGVISERDLFALQRVDLVHQARAIRSAQSVEAMTAIRGEIPKLVAKMLAHGASAEQLLRIVTQLNDHTVARVIELVLAERGDPGIAFGWIAFGSEARGEQTLLSDQDNGIIFRASDVEEARACQARLLPLAHAINTALDACGMSWCTGNVMASNPDLCLADFQWKAFYNRMVLSGSPQDLLHSTIYFDQRLVWGDDAGLADVQAHALQTAGQDEAFLRLMAAQALDRSPPAASQLGGLRHRLKHALGGGEQTIDLKTQALALFVDAVRILALGHGIRAASTVERLRSLGQQGHLPEVRAQTYEEAFNYLQQLRLHHHQQQLQAGQALDNRIDASALNPLEQRVLRGALAEAERLQSTLRLKYRL
ncbi:CBS domain-containing protein [Allofranklinella schreckenbergeri]|uniref:CBS domain-containing protein n=2 Tax=Allofranklinella schreckenbergeri TaxID=1076744 RepID=A0A3M6R6B3_9BURK|nr:CBS domain-containing protein [Allofranklinella schreckenbergeri]